MKCLVQIVLSFSLIASACNNTVPGADSNLFSSKSESYGLNEIDMQSGKDAGKQKIFNDVSIEAEGGIEVNRAFLSYETDKPVPSTNITSLGHPIYLNLILTKGWKEESGEVSIGASQKISTDDGTILLDDGDLFEKYSSINAEDAKYIKLKSVVNRALPSIKYFIVDYKIWDKNGEGRIKGSYRFFVQ